MPGAHRLDELLAFSWFAPEGQTWRSCLAQSPWFEAAGLLEPVSAGQAASQGECYG